MLSYFISNLYD